MTLSNELIFIVFFTIFVVSVLLLDLLVIGRNAHEVPLKEAAAWTIIWVSLALSFAILLRFHGEKVHGVETHDELKHIAREYAPYLKLTGSDYETDVDLYRQSMQLDYITGYLIEEILSVDNLFVMIMILNAFSVKPKGYKFVLFWGILGAIVLRFIFIFAGAALVHRFEWVLYIFGAYLVYAGAKMYIDRNKEEKIEPQHHPLVKFLSKRFRVFPRYVGNRFFIRKKGLRYITPLFVVLIFIEFIDLIFAMDSIPAIFSVTRDPFVVYFSNIFAILGLRSMFFLLVHIVKKFYYLKTGVSILLVFVGVKLLFNEWLSEMGFKSVHSLYFILCVLFGSIILSILIPKKQVNS